MAVPKDVTAEVLAAGGELNAEDQVFELGRKRVKVKTLVERHGGLLVYRLSGAIVDPRGKAHRIDGEPEVYALGQTLTVGAESDVDLTVEVERAKHGCVEQTLRAQKNARAMDALGGVERTNAFLARKQAEAAPVLVEVRDAPVAARAALAPPQAAPALEGAVLVEG